MVARDSPSARTGDARPVFHLIPHTHWDREWYLPRGAFQARLPALLTDALDQLEADPTLRFLLDGQTIIAEDALELCPEERPRIERLAVTGRLQVGPWYVLADLLIPSGEALIRNLLFGAASARALGADPMPVVYAPDAFGHPAILPTMAAEFGMTHAVVWRGTDDTATGGRDLFRWVAPNGAVLLTYHLPPAGYEVGIGLPTAPEALRRVWPTVRDPLESRAACRHVALFVGADHHAMRRDLAGLREALATIDPAREFRVSTLMEYFRAVDRDRPALATRRGELRRSPAYVWALQGVHGTRLPIKRANGAMELFLERDVDPLVALAPGGAERRLDLVHAAWRLTLQNQFHDSLAGTVSDAAAHDIEGRFQRARDLAERAATDAIEELAGHDPDRPIAAPERALVVWNPAARTRSGVVIAELVFPGARIPVGPPAPVTPADPLPQPPEALALEREDGERIGVQVLHQARTTVRFSGRRRYPRLHEAVVARVAFRAPPLSGCTLTRFRLVNHDHRIGGAGVGYRDGVLSNARVSLTATRDGAFVLEDREGDRAYPGLLAIRSEPDVGDAYTVHRLPSTPRLVRTGAIRYRGAGGPLVGWMRADYVLRGAGGAVAVAVMAALEVESSVIRWTVRLDNRANDHRLLAEVPIGLPGPLLVGAPFGTLERDGEPTAPSPGAVEIPAPTAPAQRYVARAAEGGLAVFQEGFFEYQWTDAGQLTLTLLRSIGELSRQDLTERPGHAAWPTPIPGAQCAGRHLVHIATMPLGAEGQEPGRLQQWWEDIAVPPRSRWLEVARREGGVTPTPFGSITLEGLGLAFSTCKRAMDGVGVVLRCWNDGDVPLDGAWTFERPIARATLCRADERPLAALTLTQGGRRVPFQAAPRAPATIIVV